MHFEYLRAPPADFSAIDREQNITVRWQGAHPWRDDGQIGGFWRIEHPTWCVVACVEGKEHDVRWVFDPPGSRTNARKEFGPEPRIALRSCPRPLKVERGQLPDDIAQIVAAAMLAIYSDGGEYPGVVEYRGPRGLKRTYTSKI